MPPSCAIALASEAVVIVWRVGDATGGASLGGDLVVLGAAVVMLSDTFARTAFAPTELPVGILMAVLGAPFFLFLLRREL